MQMHAQGGGASWESSRCPPLVPYFALLLLPPPVQMLLPQLSVRFWPQTLVPHFVLLLLLPLLDWIIVQLLGSQPILPVAADSYFLQTLAGARHLFKKSVLLLFPLSFSYSQKCPLSSAKEMALRTSKEEKTRPLLKANYPPKWWIACLFCGFITSGWVLSQFLKIMFLEPFWTRFTLLKGQKSNLAGWGPKFWDQPKMAFVPVNYHIGPYENAWQSWKVEKVPPLL